ncbi:glycoside hydrolase family 79 protein [Viridothelium virens]|uniref:Glycoside hydrolase family 79 protein n=1 Tax=Viridothelium virens TaxID=1048519 RepID=A0A6A6HPI2_VIRVR|nr:glycoside hydrolase family 79 protein [Viridothelium virens]
MSMPHAFTARQAVNETIRLNVPNSPTTGRQIIDAAFQSYSIEFSYMADYAGNNSYPNEFSKRMIQNLQDISGAYPIIRAGGSTQNRAIWVQNQTEAIIETIAPGADQPSALTIGPAWLQSFHQFPNGTQYIYGLSFQDGSAGLDQVLQEAVPAFQSLGDSLYAYEIGNEVDGFPGGRRSANWTVQDYATQWKQYAATVDEKLRPLSDGQEFEPLFQGGAFEAPRHLNNLSYFTVQTAEESGIASTGKVKTMADHDYMGSNCADNTVPAELGANLLNHFRMTSLMYYHDFLSNYSVAQGIPYVIGETNSISCQGEAGISDVFGAALWSIDYILYVATLKVSRMYFHQGTPYRYSAWQPIKINDTDAQPKALYYGNLFTSTALAGGNKQVDILVNGTSFTAYAIYDAANATDGSTVDASQLDSIVLVNLNMFNSTQPASERPYITVTLPDAASDAEVRRLTAPGVEVKDGISWAGRNLTQDGFIVGQEIVERVANGQVSIGAGEALLISV